MDADLIGRLDYELMTLENKKDEYTLRLSQNDDYDNVYLRRSKHGSSDYYYYIKRPGDTSYTYVGRSSKREVVKVCETRYLQEALRRVDHNIELVKSLKDGFLPLDNNHINQSLPNMYRCDSVPLSDLYREKSIEWLSRNLEFQKRFPENYPQLKTRRTSDNIKVKTTSELLIYESFKAAGLTQIYELPFIPTDYGSPLYPDFSVLSPLDLTSVIFVEYVGRMDLQKYREDFAKRTGRFIDSGYIPGVNLFFIFGDKNGNVDSLQVTKVIADILGLRDKQPS